MHMPISRRDFIDGVAMAVTAAMLPTGASAADSATTTGTATAARALEAYPPRRLGERGQYAGPDAIAHALRDGTFWPNAGSSRDTAESYDLVVVGGGLSGLAAALTYRRQAGASARVLVLENLDDFGGHAKRNEFVTSSGRTVLGHGGSQSLQTPSYFSPARKSVV